ncbi:MAM and LDL-receptor class A domain-containing protein 1-like [Orbicella faveolata]|uniref:MAM and LDL-receptor class A domain-containing protein 1-like n=2 Tax=Orbicella faveolata TaxID=48498 RepID=UPI0009E27DAB|nr:MAM and LDL-receptor class A domain-containing protein 1-like [Orbicella faveolata]
MTPLFIIFILKEYIYQTLIFSLFAASYKYCCRGMYCPVDCPLTIEFHAFGKTYLVNPSVKLTCSEHIFEKDIEVIAQPGIHPMEIFYYFTNDSGVEKGKRRIVDVKVEVALIAQLNSENVEDWTVKGWKISGGLGMVNELLSGLVESPLLPWKPFYKDVGFCLRFSFQLPTRFDSSLEVYIKTPQEKVLIWKLRGYQGNKWNSGTITLRPQEEIQIVFQGLSAVNGTPSILVDNIAITTEACATTPSYASPDFSCSPNEFQCDNGQCTSSTHRCDNDINCIDGSDEKDCTCLKVELPCSSGGCVPSDKLCNGLDDCSDGTDERFCGTSCSGNLFQCADGACVPWSSTCRRDNLPVCQDGSHLPSICGSSECPLNNLNCKDNTSETDCDKYFKGEYILISNYK